MMRRLDKVRQLRYIFIDRATYGTNISDEDYRKLRLELLRDPALKDFLPGFINDFDQLSQFWDFITVISSKYKERREFICDQFRPVIAFLEQEDIIGTQPADDDISTILSNFDTEHINIAWQKALERRNHDPEGAITMARTLMESVCKHILEEAGISYKDKNNKDNLELPQLYYRTAEHLNSTPNQHQEEAFKQIFGGCQNVIRGLGTLRNTLSDAHGKGKQAVKPSPQQAILAVNLAGSMAAFLVATWEEHSSQVT
jgi:hypothetical protein